MKTSQIVWRILFGLVVFTVASFAMLSAVWWIRNYSPYGYGLATHLRYLSETGVMGAVAIAFGCFFIGLVFYDQSKFAQEVTNFRRQFLVFVLTSVALLAVMWGYLNTVPQWTAYKFLFGRQSMYAVELRALETWPKGYFWQERPLLALLEQKRNFEQYIRDMEKQWDDPESRRTFVQDYFSVVSDSEYYGRMRRPLWELSMMSSSKRIVIRESDVNTIRQRQEQFWKFLSGDESDASIRAMYREPGWQALATFYRALGFVFLPPVLLVLGFAMGLFLHFYLDVKYRRLVVLAIILVMALVFVPQQFDPVVAPHLRMLKFMAYAPLAVEGLLLLLAVAALFFFSRKLSRLEKEGTATVT